VLSIEVLLLRLPTDAPGGFARILSLGESRKDAAEPRIKLQTDAALRESKTRQSRRDAAYSMPCPGFLILSAS
jgi:hypothetical protein